jgi:hypothetical protein
VIGDPHHDWLERIRLDRAELAELERFGKLMESISPPKFNRPILSVLTPCGGRFVACTDCAAYHQLSLCDPYLDEQLQKVGWIAEPLSKN